MGFFGMSSAGKNARNQLNNDASQASGWANTYAGNSSDQYGKANGYGDNVYAANQNAADEGLGNASDAHNAGEQLLGDQSGDLQTQQDRLKGVSDWMNNGGYQDATALSGGLQDNVGGIRQGQADRINDQKNAQQGYTDDAYGHVRTNLGNWTNNSNTAALNRNSNLTSSTNGAYNGMAARSEGVHGALVNSNNSTYGGAQSRLVAGMDANGAAQMRATAPIASSAMARMRASGVDPNSPEGASLMDHVNEARAHAADDNLAGSISQQNQLALGQDATNRGLALDSLNTSNSLAQQQNTLNRADTNQLYDAQQGIEDTRLQQNNQADMGQYNDTRQNSASQYGDQQTLANQQAQDAYTQTNARSGYQQQDLNNKVGLAQAQNGVNQQSMQYKSNAGNAGAGWANGNFNAQQQGRNGMANVYGTATNAAQGYANTSLNANGQAIGANQQVYGNEAQNAGWGVKALVGGAVAAGTALATGGLSAAASSPVYGQQRNGYVTSGVH